MAEPHQPESQYDYIVVGAGTAGCTLANRLTASGRHSVLLLEAGGRDNWIWFHIPVGYLFAMGNPRADWCYSTVAEAGLNGRALGYPRGRVIGGCSAINGMIYMRGQAADYDHWRQLGNSGWGWDDVLPYFIRAEDRDGPDSPLHGKGGEWRVERLRLSWKILDLFQDAAAEHGIPRTDDFNGGDNEGTGYFEVNQRRGVRWSAASAFLKPALGRKNLTLWTDAQVTGLVVEGKRVAGLDAPPKRPRRDRARRTRGDPRRRRGQLAASSPGVGHRRAGSAGRQWRARRARAARRRREPAGPPAASHDLSRHRPRHAEPDRQQPRRQGLDGGAIRARPARSDDHGAVADGRLHALVQRIRDAQYRVPRPAAQPRQVRRAAAQLPGFHRRGLQSAGRRAAAPCG